MKIINCKECRKQLTDEEVNYYENRCEQCEQEWLDDIEAWRKGGENKLFDELYSGPHKTIH